MLMRDNRGPVKGVRVEKNRGQELVGSEVGGTG